MSLKKKYVAKKEEISFNLEVPDNKYLIDIYEIFLSLAGREEHHRDRNNIRYYYIDNYEKMPEDKFYKDLKPLIEKFGYEDYRNHIFDSISKIIIKEKAHKRIKRFIDSEEQKGRRKFDWSEFVEGASDRIDYNPPSHFYFYTSEKGRYLKGLIHSVHCIPDPMLLELLNNFTKVYPFKVAGHSQAPTGLFIYDVLEVFYKQPYPKNIPLIMELKNTINQTYAQRKFQKYLDNIAKENNIHTDDMIEMTISSYGLNNDSILRKDFNDYAFEFHLLKDGQTKTHWIKKETGKIQKNIPKQIKEEYPEKLKYLKKIPKEIEKQLNIHSKRIEAFLIKEKTWDIKNWKKYYVQHSLIKVLTQALFWIASDNSKRNVFYINNNQFQNINGEDIDMTNVKEIKLWHPSYSDEKETKLIAKISQSLNLNQPFKQVEREKFRLEDLEKIKGKKVKKSILSQLMKSRGWKAIDSPKYKIPESDLTANLIVTETDDEERGMFSGGANLEIRSVKFLKSKKEVKVSEIKPIILSEILRDINLFISKAKLENGKS